MRGDLEQISALGAARSLLEARVADALPLNERTAKGTMTPVFDGQPGSLTFAAPLARSLGGSGLVRQVLRIAPAEGHDGRQNLIVEETPVASGPEAKPNLAATRQAVLVEDVAQVSWRYLGPDPARSSPAWSNAWHNKPVLPRLIGLTITFPPGDPRHWPELLLAPQIGSAGG